MKFDVVKNILSACLCLLFLAACGEKKEDGAVKPLIVITSPDNPPYEFKDTTQSGDQVIGFDMDVVHKLGERLGRPVKVIEADFSSIVPSLQSGRADMAIAELYPTEERRKSLDFSNPYYNNNSELLVLETSSLTSEKDLEGQKLGVQLGSANEMTGRKLMETIPGLTLVALNKVGDLVQELKNGRVQAALIGGAVAHKITKSTPGLKVVPIDISGGEIAIAFPKGSPLVAPVNEALKEMQGDIKGFEAKWINQ
jgi:ABC-type amino acid transport substrate-binding protein